jgi:hypothetical protein
MASAGVSLAPRWPSTHSMSTLGPSASERAFEMAGGVTDGVTVVEDAVEQIGDGFARGAEELYDDDEDDETRSVMTITRTITRIEDLPENKSEAIGTVLEEEIPKPVDLMIEFLGSTLSTTQATRCFLNQLYDTDLELSLECQFLPKVDLFSNSDPFAELYVREATGHASWKWALLGRTETLVDAHFPRFVTKFTLQAVPDRDLDKEVMVKVYARGSLSKSVHLGQASCTLWDIVSSSGLCKVLKMSGSIDSRKETWIVVSADVHRGRMHALAPRSVVLHVRFGRGARPRSKTHFVVNRGLSKGRWTPLYRSEGHAHAERVFRPATLTFAAMFCGDPRRAARIEFYQRRVGLDAKLAGFVQLTAQQIAETDDGRELQWFSGVDAVAPGAVSLERKELSAERIEVWLCVD